MCIEFIKGEKEEVKVPLVNEEEPIAEPLIINVNDEVEKNLFVGSLGNCVNEDNDQSPISLADIVHDMNSNSI